MNITLADCIALCGLEEGEVAGIAEHEQMPEIAAAALAQYLLLEPGGIEGEFAICWSMTSATRKPARTRSMRASSSQRCVSSRPRTGKS